MQCNLNWRKLKYYMVSEYLIGKRLNISTLVTINECSCLESKFEYIINITINIKFWFIKRHKINFKQFGNCDERITWSSWNIRQNKYKLRKN